MGEAGLSLPSGHADLWIVVFLFRYPRAHQLFTALDLAPIDRSSEHLRAFHTCGPYLGRLVPPTLASLVQRSGAAMALAEVSDRPLPPPGPDNHAAITLLQPTNPNRESIKSDVGCRALPQPDAHSFQELENLARSALHRALGAEMALPSISCLRAAPRQHLNILTTMPVTQQSA